MRKTLLLLLLGILFVVPGVIGQELGLGCCCKGQEAETGSVQEATACDTDAGFGFVELVEGDIPLGTDLSIVCDLKCGIVPPVEFIEVELACGNPAYTPEAENIFVEPVRGDNRLRLTWRQNCTENVDQYQISRCAGSGCDVFTTAGIRPAGS